MGGVQQKARLLQPGAPGPHQDVRDYGNADKGSHALDEEAMELFCFVIGEPGKARAFVFSHWNYPHDVKMATGAVSAH